MGNNTKTRDCRWPNWAYYTGFVFVHWVFVLLTIYLISRNSGERESNLVLFYGDFYFRMVLVSSLLSVTNLIFLRRVHCNHLSLLIVFMTKWCTGVSLWEPVLFIFSQYCIRWLCIHSGSLNSATVGIFTPWKLSDAAHQSFFFSFESCFPSIQLFTTDFEFGVLHSSLTGH
jgi:hypothetical protein